MSDIKLFRVKNGDVTEQASKSATVEKSLQSTIEKHSETFLGVRFLASEYSTGKSHRGRIDTLGIDEDGAPVIIEYKRATNENVVSQGLYYLDWLMDHKAEFELLVLKRLGQKLADAIEWSSTRLLCIAGDYTKYDVHSVQQINRNMELIRYSWFGQDLLLLELVNATTADAPPPGGGDGPGAKSGYSKSFTENLAASNQELTDRFESVKAFLLALGDDVQMKTLKYYVAFKRFKNFACAEVHPQAGKLTLFVRLDPDSVELRQGFTRDVRKVGHYGTGDLEIVLDSDDDFELAKPLLMKSYEAG